MYTAASCASIVCIMVHTGCGCVGLKRYGSGQPGSVGHAWSNKDHQGERYRCGHKVWATQCCACNECWALSDGPGVSSQDLLQTQLNFCRGRCTSCMCVCMSRLSSSLLRVGQSCIPSCFTPWTRSPRLCTQLMPFSIHVQHVHLYNSWRTWMIWHAHELLLH